MADADGGPGGDAGLRTGTTACDDCEVVRLTKELDAREAERTRAHELAKQRADAEHAVLATLEEARWAAEWELVKAYHETVAEVTKGAIERARDGAKYVQTAAAAIAALYTGALGLVFSVTDNPLPLRGVLAPAFLGLAVALATAYLAYVKRAPRVPLVLNARSQAELQHARTSHLTKWVAATVHNRRWAVRSSVIALAIGVAFMAAPFVSSGRAPDVPDAPTSPVIPEVIAPALEDDAAELFREQATSYREAQDARNAAIQEAADASAALADREDDLDRWFAAAALVALAVVLAGPRFVGDDDDRPAGA